MQSENTLSSNQSTAAKAGHVPGYTGHIPRARDFKFTLEDIRAKNHHKDFFLLPDNYKQHKVGYTGHSRSGIEAYRDSLHKQ